MFYTNHVTLYSLDLVLIYRNYDSLFNSEHLIIDSAHIIYIYRTMKFLKINLRPGIIISILWRAD